MQDKKWALRFLRIAREVSKWSKDPSTKIGAVAVGPDRNIIATGYNGFPKGIEDTEERLNNRELKYSLVVHAEMNCVYNANLNGVSLRSSTIYIYGLPCCSDCAKALIQCQVIEVVYTAPKKVPRWQESSKLAMDMFREANIPVEYIPMDEVDS